MSLADPEDSRPLFYDRELASSPFAGDERETLIPSQLVRDTEIPQLITLADILFELQELRAEVARLSGQLSEQSRR